MLWELHTATCLWHLQVDLRDKSVKLSFCPFCAYAGGNSLSYLNHIIIAHYNASYGCGKCLKQAFVSSSALHNNKKVCLGFTKKPATGSDSKPSSDRGGDGSHDSSTRATPKKKDSKAPATNSQGSSIQPALQMMPRHSRQKKSSHHKSHKDSKKDPSGDKKKKKKKDASPTRKGFGHKVCNDVRPMSATALLFHQHLCIFSINYFVVKLLCLL